MNESYTDGMAEFYHAGNPGLTPLFNSRGGSGRDVEYMPNPVFGGFGMLTGSWPPVFFIIP